MIDWPVAPSDSKYSAWYNQLINQAKLRTFEKGAYRERHHIIPRSFGGTDDRENLVDLTAREHYIAHALLWKMRFPGTYGSKMSFAFNTFINRMRTSKALPNITYKINSRIYESFKTHYAELLSEQMSGQGNHFYGKTHSEETKRIIGEKSKLKTFKRGSEHFNYGKPSFVTPEGKQRQIAAIKERWADPEFKSMMREKRKAYYATPEGQAQIKSRADARRGVKRDPAVVEKSAAKRRGRKFSGQALANIREGIKKKVLTPEAKAKMSFKGKGKGIPKVKKPCLHCGKMCAGNMLAKWHGDNCKLKPNSL